MNIEELINDFEIKSLYRIYLDSPNKNDSPNIDLREWITNISEGELGGFSLKECVISCIKAAIYMRSKPYDQMVKDANKNINEAKLATLSDNTKKVIESFRSDDTPDDFKVELSLNDSLNLRAMELNMEGLDKETLKSIIKDIYTQMVLREKMYQEMLKRGWLG